MQSTSPSAAVAPTLAAVMPPTLADNERQLTAVHRRLRRIAYGLAMLADEKRQLDETQKQLTVTIAYQREPWRWKISPRSLTGPDAIALCVALGLNIGGALTAATTAATAATEGNANGTS